MAALAVVDSSTPEQIQGWIDKVRKDVDPQVLTTLGEELVSEGHLPKAQYSKLATNGLQRGKLKGVLAGTGAHVHGIPCGAEWKVKADEWWETHGHIASNRFGDKLKHTAGGGMITEQVLNGQVLSQREGDTVVIDGKFPKLCEDLRNEDFAQVKAGIDPTASEFGKLFSRGALNFRTRGVTPKYGDSDYNRPKLDEAFNSTQRKPWTRCTRAARARARPISVRHSTPPSQALPKANPWKTACWRPWRCWRTAR